MYNNNNFGNSFSADDEKEMAYDLRQIYAKLVGEHLEDVAQARKADNYSMYFKTLKDLFVVVKHKFKKGRGENTDEEGIIINKTDLEIYSDLMAIAVKCANKYPVCWTGKNKEPKECAEIEKALNDIEMFLYKKIDEAGMLGNKYSDDEGL